MFLRKTAGSVAFAAAVVAAAKESSGDDSAKGGQLIRAKDLPIYSTIHPTQK